jgi:hypothetical protein
MRLVIPYCREQIEPVPTVEEIDTAILRRMTPERKLAVMHALWLQAWDLKWAGIRLQHPEWTDDRVADRVRELFRDAGS